MGFNTLGSNVFDRQDLAGHIMAVNNRAGFALGRVAPALAVDKATGTLLVVSATTGMGLEDTKRGKRSAYPEIAGKLETVTYATEDHGAAFPVDAVQAKAYANQLEMDQAGSAAAFGTVMRRAEYDFWQDATNGVYNRAGVAGNAGAAAWTSYSSATPGADVAREAAEIQKLHGVPKEQCSLVISRDRAEKLPFVADVRARLQITTAPFPGSLTEQQLAQYFGVGEVIIAGAVYNTANEGQTASLGYCHPTDKALLFVKGSNNPATTAGFARTAVWDDNLPQEEIIERAESFGVPVIIDQWWDAKTRTMYYRARNYRGFFFQLDTMARKITGI